MKPNSLDEAWNDFAGGLPVGCEAEYKALQVSFYVGASAIYCLAMQARKLGTKDEAHAKMSEIYDELDAYMRNLHFTVYAGETQGNA